METDKNSVREQMYIIIFEAETKAGRLFDVLLLWAILASVAAVVLESVADLRLEYGQIFWVVEWAFTLLFTAEYVARIYCSRSRSGYIKSFYGIVDLLSILPTYIALLVQGAQVMMVIRAVRLLRVFRLFKLTRHISEAEVLVSALAASRAKITVFLGSVVTLVVIIGSLMYLIEGPENGFTSIPVSIYWAIVTMTTVGYGDISPRTPLGQVLASAIMIIGYGIIAVPTGIVSVELQAATQRQGNTRHCGHCHLHGHDPRAAFCRACGSPLSST